MNWFYQHSIYELYCSFGSKHIMWIKENQMFFASKELYQSYISSIAQFFLLSLIPRGLTRRRTSSIVWDCDRQTQGETTCVGWKECLKRRWMCTPSWYGSKLTVGQECSSEVTQQEECCQKFQPDQLVLNFFSLLFFHEVTFSSDRWVVWFSTIPLLNVQMWPVWWRFLHNLWAVHEIKLNPLVKMVFLLVKYICPEHH